MMTPINTRIPNKFVQNLDNEARRNILEDEKAKLIKDFEAKMSDIEKQMVLLG